MLVVQSFRQQLSEIGEYRVRSFPGRDPSPGDRFYFGLTEHEGRPAIIKLANPALRASRLALEREARVLSDIGSRADVVELFDVGVARFPMLTGEAVTCPFLVLSRADSCLETALQSRHGLSWGTTRRCLRDVASGLVGVHRAGWVHSDLKPDNVLVEAGERFRLADFGEARRPDDPQEPRHVGKLGEFQAPEDVVGVESDVYSLGVLIHTLCFQLDFRTWRFASGGSDRARSNVPTAAVRVLRELRDRATQPDRRLRVVAVEDVLAALQVLPA